MYCFKCYRKFIQHAVSTFKHYLIITPGWNGPNWTILRKYEAPFSIHSICLDIRKSFFYIKKIISWYQQIDFLTTGNLNFISRNGIDFFISKVRFFYIKKRFIFFLNRLFDIKKYRINCKKARYLFHIFLYSNSRYKNQSYFFFW